MAGSNRGNLVVGLNGRRVALLRRVPNGARLTYEPDVVTRLGGAPLLSTALPVRAQEFDAGLTAAWFRGLLPEDARLEQVKAFYSITGDYLDVLEQIGWECAGAVEVMAESQWEKREEEPPDYEELEPEGLARRLCALPAHPYDDERSMRMSLGGFQSKLCVYGDPLGAEPHVAASGFALPLAGAPSTHILKPEPRRFAGLAESEAWAMRVAGAVTPTARVALLDLEGAPPTLCIERFDRARGQGWVARLHQEDCAQALGIEPERKYASQGSPKKGDPSFKRIAALLGRYATDAEAETWKLFDQMAVNVSLGNTDAHAKNYSLLRPTVSTVALAPLYDVVPAREVTPDVRAMGMRVANQITLERVGCKELLDEGASWGLSRPQMEDRLERLMEGLLRAMGRVRDVFPTAAGRHEALARERIARILGSG